MTKFYRVLGVTALLFCSDILAQGVGVSGPNVSRGNLLRKPEYQTYSALGLFVDPTGNDNNACTATGVDACLTIQGAVNKVPKRVRHPVTIDLATGTYAGFQTAGYLFDPVDATLGAYIWTRGTLKTATVATGTATGTATAGSIGSGVTFGTMTDGTQAWTVNNLKGFLLEITGGTGVGQFRVIEGNTATVITIAGFWTTAPAAGSTYAIRDWNAVITAGTPQTALPNSAAGGGDVTIKLIDNVAMTRLSNSSSPLFFEKIKILPPSAFGVLAIGGDQNISFLHCRLQGGPGFPAVTLSHGASGRFDTNYALSDGSTVNFGGSNVSANTHSTFFVTRSMFETSGGASGVALSLTGSGAILTQNEFRTTGAASLAGILIPGPVYGTQANNNRVECAAASTTAGIRYVEAFSTASFASVGGSEVAINNCATGIAAQGTIRIITSGAWAFTTLTTGILASKGAVINLSSTSTFTTVGSEISIDGTVYTAAVLNALVPPVITNLNYGTWVGR